METIVKVTGVHKYFPGVHALDNVDFTLRQGEIMGLVGENGAGKSTLNKVLSGVERFDAGEYLWDGRPVRFQNAAEAIEAGISVIHQELNLCDAANVAENISIGDYPARGRIFLDRKRMHRRAEEALQTIGLEIPTHVKVEHLSTAQQQLVEIARAISRDSRLIIMDEPTSALAPNEITALHGIMDELRRKGVSIIYITHKLEEIFVICDRISVMRDGKMIATVDSDAVSKEDLIAMMVGRTVSEMFQRTATEFGKTVLEASHITNHQVCDVSFHIRQGEIVGFSGLMGAGRTELAKAVFGYDKRLSGTVSVDGVEVKPGSTEQATRLGIGYVSEDRKAEGIFQFFPIRHNLSIITLKSDSRLGVFIDGEKELRTVRQGMKDLHVRATGEQQLIATLSGGNQQKVILARWLVSENLKVLIVDEPTRGIDVAAKAEIYAILDELAKQGLAILVISSEMQEIMSLCDRVYIMKDGGITGMLAREEITQTKLLEYSIL